MNSISTRDNSDYQYQIEDLNSQLK